MAEEQPSDDQLLDALSKASPAIPSDDDLLKALDQASAPPAPEPTPATPAAAPTPAPVPETQPAVEPAVTPEETQARAVYKGQLQEQQKKLQDSDTSDKRTAADLADMNPNELVPFISGIHAAVNYTQLYRAAKRLQSGESQPVDSNVDYQLIKNYLQQQKDEQKPETFGYKFWNTVLHLPSFAVELIATAGGFKVGKAVAQEAILRSAEKLIAGAAENKAVQLGAKAAGTVAGAAVQATLSRPGDIAGGAIQRLTPSVDFTPNEAGQVEAIVKDPNDGFFKAMAKSYGNEFVEVFTEHTGGAIGEALARIPGAKRLALLKEAVLAKWFGKQKGTTSEILARLKQIKQDAAWDGLLSEMGEEQLGDILKPALGITDSYQQHLQSPTDVAAEAAAFALPGMAGHALARGAGAYEGVARSRAKTALETQRQSPERAQSLLARRQEIERQDLTDDIMRAGAAQPGEPNAVQEPSATEILQRQPVQTGEQSGGRVQPLEQGPEVTPPGETQSTGPGTVAPSIPIGLKLPKPGHRNVESYESQQYIQNGGGWKLHLAVDPRNYQAVDDWLKKNHKGQYKLLAGGDHDDGKDFTVYVGSKNNADALASKIKTEIGGLLDKHPGPSEDVLFNDKVAGRFDVQSAVGGRHRYYGSGGVPYDDEAKKAEYQVHMAKRDGDTESAKQWQKILDNHKARVSAELDAQYGAYFSGKGGVTATPTPAQAAAGNYAKRKLSFQGLPISVENEKGSIRTNKGKGKPWSVTMPATYGYIRGTEGNDGDKVDAYVGPNENSPHVFVVDQQDADTRKFDEHKAMLGFDSLGDALTAYQAAFSDGKGGQRIKGVAAMSVDEFKDWLKKGKQTKPVEEAVKAQPEVVPAPLPSIPPTKKEFRVMTPPAPGRKSVVAHGMWDVIDASAVGALGGITELQSRNRYGANSKQQIADISAKLDPRLLGDSATVMDGAPVVDENGDRIAGYGRLASIKAAYESGNEPSKRYRKFVQQSADALGLGDKAKGMKSPILVRRALQFEGGDRAEFADLSNADPGLEYTPAELARNDAKLILSNNLLALFKLDEHGNIGRRFKDAFYNGIKQKSGLRSSDGNYLPAMDSRIQAAILTALFEKANNERLTFLVRAAVERAPALGIMPQINGLIESAPRLLDLGATHPDFDLAVPLARALLDFVEFRRRVQNGYLKKIGEFMDQLDLFEEGRSAESGIILEQLGALKSVPAVAEFFTRYVAEAEKEAKAGQTADMFSGKVEKRSTADLLGKARNETTNVGKNGGGSGEAEATNANAAGTAEGGKGQASDFIPSQGAEPRTPDELKTPSQILWAGQEAEPMALMRQHLAAIWKALKEGRPVSAEAVRKYEILHYIPKQATGYAYDAKTDRFVPSANRMKVTGPMWKTIAALDALDITQKTAAETKEQAERRKDLTAKLADQMGVKGSKSDFMAQGSTTGLTSESIPVSLPSDEGNNREIQGRELAPEPSGRVNPADGGISSPGAQNDRSNILPGGAADAAHVSGWDTTEPAEEQADHSLDQVIEFSKGRLLPVLQYVGANSENRFYRQLAKLLVKFELKTKVGIWDVSDLAKADPQLAGKKPAGLYSPSQNLVVLMRGIPNQELTLLHEAVHAVSSMQLRDTSTEFAKAIKHLFHLAAEQGVHGYGMTNLREFVAESFTNPDFQEQLKGVRVPAATLWQRFVDVVRRMLGLKEKYSNALLQVIEQSVQHMRPDSELLGAANAKGVDPSLAPDTKTAEAALNTAGTRGPSAVETEARGISGQVTFLRRKIEQHTPSGEDNIISAALHKIGYDEILGTAHLVDGLVDPEELGQGLERLKGNPLRATYAKEAGMRFKLMKSKMQGVIEDYNKLLEEVTSEPFQERMLEKGAQAAELAWFQLAQTYFDADVARLMSQLKTLAETESRQQGRAEGVYGQLKANINMTEAGINGLTLNARGQLKMNMAKAGYSEAVKATIASIVTTFAKDENALAFLYSAVPADVQRIIDTYNRLKPEGQPDPMVTKWAAEILTRAKEITRSLLAIESAKANEKVRRHYDTLVTTIFDEWKKSPGKTSKKIVKAISTFATDAEKARAAYAAIHREFAMTAKNLDVLETAATIARSVLEDDETKGYEKLAYSVGRLQERGGGVFLDQDPDALRLNEGIALPDGSVTGPIVLEGDVATFANTFQTMRSAAEKIQTWLEDNPDRIEGEYWRALLEHLDNVLLTSRVWSPTKTRAPLRQPGPWGMLKFLLEDIGTRESGRAKVDVDNFKRAEDMAKGLYFENNARLTNAMTDAAKSHGIKGKTRYSQWYDTIGRELLDSWQNPEGGLEAGAKIKGIKVTPQDMALVKLMAQLSGQGFDIVQRGITRGREGVVQPVWFKTDLGATGVKMHVQSTMVTKHTVPRTFNPEGLRFVDGWMRADAGGKLELLNSHFRNIVLSYLRDRANTFFDGLSPHEEAYRTIANEIDDHGLADSDSNMHWLVGKIAEIEAPEEDETEEEQHARITADLLHEFDRQNERVHNYYEREDKDVQIETLEQRSSFTKSRGQKLAGYWLYNTGWKDGNAFANFAHAIHGYYYTRAAQALSRVSEDLLRQRGDLDAKMRRFAVREKMPLDKAKDKAVEEQARQVEAGQTFDDYRELERKLANVSSMIKDFASIYGDEGKDNSIQFGKLRRFFNATGLSVLVSELTALRNVGFGWVKQGRMLSHYQGMIFAGYPKAFYQMWIRTMAPLVGSTALSIAKTGTVGLAKGVYQGVSGLNQGPAAALGRFLEPMLTEMTQRSFERMRLNREMFDRGLVNRNYAADDFIAKLQNLREGGVIRETPLYTSALGNLGSGLMTIYDAAILTTVGRPLFPRWADIALNHSGVVGAFDSLDKLEKQLRVVHRRWSAAGRTFDGSTPLSPKEVFGGWYAGARTANDLVQLTHWFEHGRIGYQEAALRFLKKLDKGDQEAEFLSEEERWQLAEAFVEDLNKGEATNRPLQLKKGGIWDIVAPLQGWNVNELRTYIKHFSRAVDPKTSKALLWMSLGMLFVAPALAAGSFGDVFNEWMARLLYKYLRGEERATRQPWEREGTRSQTIGWAISIANPIPFIQTVVNTMLNDMPNRASSDPIVFLQSKAMDIAHYAGGVVQTGDMTYGLPRLVKSFLPLSSVFINRMDGVAGSLEALDARRLMTRYGPQELLKPQDHSQTQTATELTPYGEKMLNAAMEGKDAKFVSIYNQAVEKARSMGMANPEKVVRQMYAARNPYDRAFKQKLDPEQRQAFLSKLNGDERTLVDDVEARYAHAAGLINAPANFERAQTAGIGGIQGIPRGSIAGATAGQGGGSAGGAVVGRARASRRSVKGLSRGRRISGIGARKLRGPGLSRGKGLRAFR